MKSEVTEVLRQWEREDSMRFIISKGVKTFIEFAPGKVLKGLLKKIDPTVETICVGTLEDFHVIETVK